VGSNSIRVPIPRTGGGRLAGPATAHDDVEIVVSHEITMQAVIGSAQLTLPLWQQEEPDQSTEGAGGADRAVVGGTAPVA
jgi:hypothetical protein